MENILRVSKNYTEVLGVLKEIMENSSSPTIWQNDGGKRTIQQCRLKSIDRKLGTFAVQPFDKSIPFNFCRDLTLYLKGDEQSILFKGEIQFTSKNLVILKIPTEVRIIEKRRAPRSYFSLESAREIIIAKYEGPSRTPRLFSQSLLDISEGGVAFFVSLQQMNAIKTGDIIFIKEI